MLVPSIPAPTIMGIRIHTKGPDGGIRTSVDPADVARLVASGAFFWLDLDGDEEVMRALLQRDLGLHPLAVEDIFQERMIPKVEDYGDYLYVVVHGIACDHDDPEDLHTMEVDLVLGARWVVSHHGGMRATEEVLDECRRNGRLFDKGAGFIAHAIMDHVVDYYVPVIDTFDRYVDEVESAVVANPQQTVLQRIFRLKRSLQRLRRIAMHQREVLLRLSRGEFDQVPEKALPFFRDIHDHFVRVSDLADGYRELLSGALDAYLSVVSNRMNEVMKTLTLVATIMLPLTFIAGLYGMNFDHMPELHWRFGYPMALLLMAAVAVGMALWFRYKRWL
jgi:magnesium transporter